MDLLLFMTKFLEKNGPFLLSLILSHPPLNPEILAHL